MTTSYLLFNIFFTPAIIKEACLWFFNTWELIAECPNQVPVGLGHSQMDYNMSVLTVGSSEPNSGFMSDEPDVSEGFDKLDHDEWPLSDLDSTADEVPSKRKALVTSGERQGKSSVTGLKTGPQPGTSKPATKAPKNPVKRQKKDEFSKIAQAEKVTRQKELEVAKARIEKDTVRAKAKLAKLELEKEKLAYAREWRQEKMRMCLTTMEGTSQQHGFPKFNMHNTFPSPSSSSHPYLLYPPTSAYYQTPSSPAAKSYASENTANTASRSFDASSIIFCCINLIPST
ncbi:hypothetical protein F4604DRAFT_1929117 [Suillus subluteus]|nr:hypothetical protein F4604DRAFT_1929117 [Suillus subluteus]